MAKPANLFKNLSLVLQTPNYAARAAAAANKKYNELAGTPDAFKPAEFNPEDPAFSAANFQDNWAAVAAFVSLLHLMATNNGKRTATEENYADALEAIAAGEFGSFREAALVIPNATWRTVLPFRKIDATHNTGRIFHKLNVPYSLTVKDPVEAEKDLALVSAVAQEVLDILDGLE